MLGVFQFPFRTLVTAKERFSRDDGIAEKTLLGALSEVL